MTKPKFWFRQLSFFVTCSHLLNWGYVLCCYRMPMPCSNDDYFIYFLYLSMSVVLIVCFCLQDDDTLLPELEADIREECNKLGPVESVKVSLARSSLFEEVDLPFDFLVSILLKIGWYLPEGIWASLKSTVWPAECERLAPLTKKKRKLPRPCFFFFYMVFYRYFLLVVDRRWFPC